MFMLRAVFPILLEPLPGWVDTLNGIGGILVGAGKGVIRSMHCIPTYNAEIIPVDFAINTLIVLTYIIGTSKKKYILLFCFNKCFCFSTLYCI